MSFDPGQDEYRRLALLGLFITVLFMLCVKIHPWLFLVAISIALLKISPKDEDV